MIPLNFTDVQIVIAGAVFLLGCMCVVFGTFVLISRGYSKEVRALASHTARIGQKGVAQEITGLVTSASELVASLNQLVKTANGIGVFLIVLGLSMMGAAYWMILQIEWTV